MIEPIQLDFFRDPEICRLEHQIDKIAVSSDKVRKGLYARNNKLQKEVNELREELEFLKSMLCRKD